MKMKKLLSLSILLLLTIGLLGTLDLGIMGVSAPAYPAVYVEPVSTIDIPHRFSRFSR